MVLLLTNILSQHKSKVDVDDMKHILSFILVLFFFSFTEIEVVHKIYYKILFQQI